MLNSFRIDCGSFLCFYVSFFSFFFLSFLSFFFFKEFMCFLFKNFYVLIQVLLYFFKGVIYVLLKSLSHHHGMVFKKSFFSVMVVYASLALMGEGEQGCTGLYCIYFCTCLRSKMCLWQGRVDMFFHHWAP